MAKPSIFTAIGVKIRCMKKNLREEIKSTRMGIKGLK